VAEAAVRRGGVLDIDLVAMPKAELHLHLDGSLRPATVLELARGVGLVDHRATVESIRRRLTGPARSRDQAEYLRAFDLPIAVMQDEAALERVARELVLDVATDGTRYVEVRWGPALHTRSLSLDQVIDAVAAGTADGARRSGVVARLIATAIRSHDPALNVDVAEAAARARSKGVVGFDLAGDEAGFPDPTLHRAAFEAAAAGGLRLTVHAGEWDGAAQVVSALALGVERIAHGATAIQGTAVVRELIARGVTLDLCPTSNVQAGLFASVEQHPLRDLVRAGVPATLSTDARTVTSISLVEEYARAAQAGLTPTELWRLDRHAIEAAFADDATLQPLRSEFDRWAAGQAALGQPALDPGDEPAVSPPR
jgi:adenosine deaminase